MVGEAELHNFQAVWFVKNILHLDTLIQLFVYRNSPTVCEVCCEDALFFAAYGCYNERSIQMEPATNMTILYYN